MIDVVFAILGAAGFIVFCSVLIVFVPHTDLVVVIVLVLLMVCYDFARDLLSRRGGDR